MKRLLSAILALTMALCLMPNAALATGDNYLTFSSEASFTLKTNNGQKNWTGTAGNKIEYSTDLSAAWQTWDGTTTLSSGSTAPCKLYLRGTNNTKIAGNSASGEFSWVLTGSNIACTGNIENLLDYATVAAGNHPAMANDCYNAMFNGCTGLTEAPTLPATALTEGCYMSMFYGCTGLTAAPALPATTLAKDCYNSMFTSCAGLTAAPELPATTLAESCYSCMFILCSNLKVSATQGGDYTVAWRIPTTDTAAEATSWSDNMLMGTGGSFTGAPALNTTYYLAPAKYAVTHTLTNLTATADTAGDGKANSATDYTTTLTAASGYVLPAAIAVTIGGAAATGYTYDKATGIVTVPAAKVTGAIVITAAGAVAPVPYLTFSSEASFTLKTNNGQKNWNGTLEYSTDLSAAWQTWDGTTTLSSSTAPCKLYLRGTGNSKITGDTDRQWVLTGSGIACTGNIENLLDYATVAAGGHPTMAGHCYNAMFDNCTSLTAAPDLPATALAEYCYSNMFDDCTELTAAPALPATELKTGCYYYMFAGCTKLGKAPELKATTLANECYKSMFYGCTGLTAAPALPAMALAGSCYYGMFYGCTGLTAAPVLPATALAASCYYGMFYGCTGLTAAPALPVMTLAESCYCGMFEGCTGLTSAPALNATTLKYECYYGMFKDCTGLTTAPALPATTLAARCYGKMFMGCTSLTAAPVLPATTLAESCYYGMFNGCTSLAKAPELNATTLAESCYANMFNGCTRLTKAPALPAKALSLNCYNTMFKDAGLTTAPELPATKLAQECYCGMFQGCTALTAPPALPATVLEIGCYVNMFNGCTSLKVSATQDNDYTVEWRIPTTGTATTATSWNTDMLANTGGAFTGNPTIDTTYYLYGFPAYTMDFSQTAGVSWGSFTGHNFSTTNASDTGWDWAASTKTLTLSGLNFTTAAATALKLPDGAKLVLADGTTSTVKSVNTTEKSSYAIHAVGSLEISGGGTVNASGGGIKDSTGLYGCGNVTISGGTVNATGGAATASSNGILMLADYSLAITGGTVNATGGNATNKYGMSYGMLIVGIRSGSTATPTLTLSGGTVTAIGGAGGTEGGSFGILAGYGGSIIIKDEANVTAKGGAGNSYGMGFGGGTGEFTISGGTTYATGNSDAVFGLSGEPTGMTVTGSDSSNAAEASLTAATWDGSDSNNRYYKIGAAATAAAKTLKFVKSAPTPTTPPTGGVTGDATGGDDAPETTNTTIYNSNSIPAATIWLTGNNLPGGELLITEALTSGGDYDALLKLADTDDIFRVYNIFLKSGKKSTGSAMFLTFDLADGYAAQDLTLVQKKADDTFEYLYATADARGDLKFGPLYELSSFMLVKGTLTQYSGAQASIPQTGDSAAPELWIGVAALSAIGLAGCVMMRRRKKHNS